MYIGQRNHKREEQIIISKYKGKNYEMFLNKKSNFTAAQCDKTETDKLNSHEWRHGS
jgi:hypothetical protein